MAERRKMPQDVGRKIGEKDANKTTAKKPAKKLRQNAGRSA